MSTKKSPETIARELIERLGRREGELRPMEEWDDSTRKIGELFVLDIAAAISNERAKVQKLEKALLFILGQPFKGYWDAQAVFIQDTLKGLE